MPETRAEDFQSSVARPRDFDAFWTATLEETERIPLDTVLEPAPLRSTDDVEVFEATYASYGGLRIAGWYCRPRHALRPLPGLLIVPGYAGEPPLPTAFAKLGYAVFSAAPRGKLRSNADFNPGYPGLLTHNADDRDGYGYRGFYMDAIRAFDLLAGLPEVDAERLGVRGSSQGGALTLLVAALRSERVKAASAGAPYLCSMLAGLPDPLVPLRGDQRLSAPLSRARGHDARRARLLRHSQLRRSHPVPHHCEHRPGGRRLPSRDGIRHVPGDRQRRQTPPHLRELRSRCGRRSRARGACLRLPFAAPSTRFEGRDASVTETLRDFDSYWQQAMDDVEKLSGGAVEIEEIPLRSSEAAAAFGVRFNGVGHYPLFAYFTVPKGTGPFPALFQAPPYGSVVGVPAHERQQRYAVMALCHRGQRLSDSGYSAAYPGLLTDGLPGRKEYRWRAIVADCLRALDVFVAQPQVDGSRVAVVGSDLAAITAALRPQASYLLVNGQMLFRDTMAQLDQVEAYPLEEFNDYLRSHPTHREQIADTLSMFDPLAFAPRIQAETMVTCGTSEIRYAEAFRAALGTSAALAVRSGRGYLDHGLEEDWLSRVLRD